MERVVGEEGFLQIGLERRREASWGGEAHLVQCFSGGSYSYNRCHLIGERERERERERGKGVLEKKVANGVFIEGWR